jgi:hypothetical protein
MQAHAAPVLWASLATVVTLMPWTAGSSSLGDPIYTILATGVLAATILPDVVWYVYVLRGTSAASKPRVEMTCRHVRSACLCIVNTSVLLLWLASRSIPPNNKTCADDQTGGDAHQRAPLKLVLMAGVLVFQALVLLSQNASSTNEEFSDSELLEHRPYMRHTVHAAVGVSALHGLRDTRLDLNGDGFWDSATVALVSWLVIHASYLGFLRKAVHTSRRVLMTTFVAK